MKRYLLFFLLIGSLALVGSCAKDDAEDPYKEAQEQLGRDTVIIRKFLTDNNLTFKKHSSGVYYQIIEPGTGSHTYMAASRVSVKYNGKLLNGAEFDKSETPVTFTLGNLIVGWQIGIPLIQKGGKIRLLIPSGYAYGPQAQTQIPGNSILDFTIELIDVL